MITRSLCKSARKATFVTYREAALAAAEIDPATCAEEHARLRRLPLSAAERSPVARRGNAMSDGFDRTITPIDGLAEIIERRRNEIQAWMVSQGMPLRSLWPVTGSVVTDPRRLLAEHAESIPWRVRIWCRDCFGEDPQGCFGGDYFIEELSFESQADAEGWARNYNPDGPPWCAEAFR